MLIGLALHDETRDAMDYVRLELSPGEQQRFRDLLEMMAHPNAPLEQRDFSDNSGDGPRKEKPPGMAMAAGNGAVIS